MSMDTKSRTSLNETLQEMLTTIRMNKDSLAVPSEFIARTSREQELMKRIRWRETRRDQMRGTPGGDEIASAYQREIDSDMARLERLRTQADRSKL